MKKWEIVHKKIKKIAKNIHPSAYYFNGQFYVFNHSEVFKINYNMYTKKWILNVPLYQIKDQFDQEGDFIEKVSTIMQKIKEKYGLTAIMERTENNCLSKIFFCVLGYPPFKNPILEITDDGLTKDEVESKLYEYFKNNHEIDKLIRVNDREIAFLINGISFQCSVYTNEINLIKAERSKEKEGVENKSQLNN